MIPRSLFQCLILVLLLFGVNDSHAGGEDRSYALGLNVNSNSYFIGGVDFAIKHFDGGDGFLLIEAVNVKHANEVRWASGFNGTNLLGNKPFVLGKNNYLFALRGQFGKEILMFHKGNKNGVQVALNIAGGVTIGFEKPYFVRYAYTSETTEIEQYDANVHQFANILGSAGPIYGFEKSSIVPGLNARGSMEFEYGSGQKFQSIIETGILLEMFSRPIELLDGAPTQRLFGSVFIALYIGKN